MNIPALYKRIREELPDEVSFGCGGIKLFGTTDIENAQVGYSVAPDGTTLSSEDKGGWRSSWLVIGNETGCGDPLFIDIDAPELPVLTAMHGEEQWTATEVAGSAETFAKCLEEFSRISIGRRNSLEREVNPVSDDERRSFLTRIAQLNRLSDAPPFWDILLEF